MKAHVSLTAGNRRALISWLAASAFCVFLMVVIGGLTRLSESGLSIVEWQPVRGALPPLGDAAWQAEFLKYQTSPQYRLINHGMTLEDFKDIFWLEYLHRLMARLTGLVCALPLAWFVFRRAIPKDLALKGAGFVLLGGAQGLVGWLMVKSGLQHDPVVSPYRLAFHLGLAFVIYGLIVWQLLRLLWPPVPDAPPHASLVRLAWMTTGAVLLQVLLGALVAGNDAGLVYNTFPLMDGAWLPPGLFAMEPLLRNVAENVILVQFNHRVMAMVLGLVLLALCWRVWRAAPAHRGWAAALLGAFIAQFSLGVATLLHMVPLALASLHQAVAVLLFTCALTLLYRLRFLPYRPAAGMSHSSLTPSPHAA